MLALDLLAVEDANVQLMTLGVLRNCAFQRVNSAVFLCNGAVLAALVDRCAFRGIDSIPVLQQAATAASALHALAHVSQKVSAWPGRAL